MLLCLRSACKHTHGALGAPAVWGDMQAILVSLRVDQWRRLPERVYGLRHCATKTDADMAAIAGWAARLSCLTAWDATAMYLAAHARGHLLTMEVLLGVLRQTGLTFAEDPDHHDSEGSEESEESDDAVGDGEATKSFNLTTEETENVELLNLLCTKDGTDEAHRALFNAIPAASDGGCGALPWARFVLVVQARAYHTALRLFADAPLWDDDIYIYTDLRETLTPTPNKHQVSPEQLAAFLSPVLNQLKDAHGAASGLNRVNEIVRLTEGALASLASSNYDRSPQYALNLLEPCSWLTARQQKQRNMSAWCTLLTEGSEIGPAFFYAAERVFGSWDDFAACAVDVSLDPYSGIYLSSMVDSVLALGCPPPGRAAFIKAAVEALCAQDNPQPHEAFLFGNKLALGTRLIDPRDDDKDIDMAQFRDIYCAAMMQALELVFARTPTADTQVVQEKLLGGVLRGLCDWNLRLHLFDKYVLPDEHPKVRPDAHVSMLASDSAIPEHLLGRAKAVIEWVGAGIESEPASMQEVAQWVAMYPALWSAACSGLLKVSASSDPYYKTDVARALARELLYYDSYDSEEVDLSSDLVAVYYRRDKRLHVFTPRQLRQRAPEWGPLVCEQVKEVVTEYVMQPYAGDDAQPCVCGLEELALAALETAPFNRSKAGDFTASAEAICARAHNVLDAVMEKGGSLAARAHLLMQQKFRLTSPRAAREAPAPLALRPAKELWHAAQLRLAEEEKNNRT